MARVSVDIKEMPKSIDGYTCILVCICDYTNWIKAIPLVDQKAVYNSRCYIHQSHM